MEEKEENMTQTTNMRGIGYFDTLFSVVEMPTMAEALKQFALEHQVTGKSNQGEVLNDFVSILIKTLDVEDFQAVSTQLFSYPKRYRGVLEVEEIEPSKEKLIYLKANIDRLLQEEIEVRSRIDGEY